MKIMVVYDSTYGNTERIAKAIGGAIAGEAVVVRAGEVNPAELKTIDILIVGSPTYGGRPIPSVQEFLDRISESDIKGKKVATFDTRFSTRMVRIFGFAADKISDNLRAKGGTLISSPQGFFVKGKEGPLKEGELERAAGWAKEIAA
jgi:flavodoxin I